jgi:hypothetical protein
MDCHFWKCRNNVGYKSTPRTPILVTFGQPLGPSVKLWALRLPAFGPLPFPALLDPLPTSFLIFSLTAETFTPF